MKLARVLADWLQARITADGTHTALVDSLADGDDKNPEKIAAVWEIEDTERLSATLRRFDAVLAIRRPVDNARTEAEQSAFHAFVRAQITTAAFNALVSDVTAAGLGTLQDWYYGDSETENDTSDYRTEQRLHLWIVEG